MGNRLNQLEQVVSAGMSARRELWRILVDKPHQSVGTRLLLSESEGREWEAKLEPPVAIEPLIRCGWVDVARPEWTIDAHLLEAHALLQPFLELLVLGEEFEARREKMKADVAFLVFRDIKGHHAAAGDPNVYSMFRRITQSLPRLIEERPAKDWWHPDAQEKLRRSCAQGGLGEGPRFKPAEYLDLFLEVCLSLEELDRERPRTALLIRREWLDADFLLSRLYGMRTGIPGFDILFGGGGLSLADPLGNPISPARIILIRGPFGSGKSLLGVTLASEVMRKGGAATVVSLDATLDSLVGYVGAFDLAPDTPAGWTVSERSDAFDRSGPASPATGGGLRLLRSLAARESWDELLARIERHLSEASKPYSTNGPRTLNLLVIDPVNSVLKIPPDPAEVRQQLMGTLKRARQDFGNIVLVAEGQPSSTSEHPQSSGPWTDVLAYVADVVIDVGSETSHGYDRHYIQVSKSRFQRERPGRHPFDILPGRGISVSASSAAYRSEFFPHGHSAPVRSLDDCGTLAGFGLPDFDRLLGDEPLWCGDTVVMRGPEGSFKTLLGIHFLLAKRDAEAGNALRPRSLFLTDRSDMSFRSYFEAHRLFGPVPTEKLVTLAPLPTGFVHPGQVLREIQRHFSEARDRGWFYDRVLMVSVGRWDVQCPFIREDPEFGSALLDLFRSEQASAVIVCGEKQFEDDSALQRTVVDRGTVLIDFQRLDYNGAQRTMMRVARARSAPRTRDWSELRLEGGGLHVDPSLLRVHEKGVGSPPSAEPVVTTLQFYQVGRQHRRYHEALRARLHNMLTTPVSVSPIDRVVLADAARLGPLSVGSHLRLVQVDEFQLPTLRALPDGRPLLHPFPLESVRVDWDDDPTLQKAICYAEEGQGSSRQYVVAFPYYRNLGLLTVKRDELNKYAEPDAPTRWLLLAEASKQYSKDVGDEGPLFFDCAKRPEDYNCLFLEMVLSLTEGFPCGGDAENRYQELREWIKRPAFTDALVAFHMLCARAHRTSPWTKDHLLGPAPWESVVSRQWCTSLRYWFDECRRAERPRRRSRWRRSKGASAGFRWSAGGGAFSDIEVVPLPGEVAVSGEWFIGVWSHSAVPEIGHKIIETLTSAQAQLERVNRGIGLPVNSRLFGEGAVKFLPYANAPKVDLRSLVTKAKRRSDLYNYDVFKDILAQNLIEFLGSTQNPVVSVTGVVRRLLDDIEKVSQRPQAPGADA